jgi:hypothetical protein
VPIPGTKRTERLEENIGAAEVDLTDTQLSDLRVAADQVQIVGGPHPSNAGGLPVNGPAPSTVADQEAARHRFFVTARSR